MSGRLSFVGRDAELAELGRALTGAEQGRGGVWLLTGIAGIGKSRLADEVSRDAIDRGFTVAWGRCWEAGGAPAFWPWLQAMRALFRDRGDQLSATSRRRIAPLLPQLSTDSGGPAAEHATHDAQRFELLDAMTTSLCEVAAAGPVLLVLDDLHVADHSTLMLLHFAARQLQSTGVLILGTLRDRDAHRNVHAGLISRVSQDANTLALGPLDLAAVESYVGDAASGAQHPSALAATLHQRTDGHPLFLVELVRLILSGPAGRADELGQLNWPAGLEHALRDHLGAVSEEHRSVLEMAAIMGRELSAPQLARYFDQPNAVVRSALEEAVRLGLVMATSAEHYRFSHILVRDLLERELARERRFALHGQLAEAMTAERGEHAWSEVAHHFAAAGPRHLVAAVRAHLCAGEAAIAGFAFEDAAEACQRALGLLDEASGEHDGLRGDALILLCRAQMLAGNVDEGQQRCVEALAMARTRGDAELFARAALERGSSLVFARVDRDLVALLEEALAGLPEGDSRLRALVQARLAAAMQPAKEPAAPIELALEAIHMARRLDHEPTLLAALRTGCSALVDLAPARIRMPLNAEHARLAARAGEGRDVLRAETRLIFDCFELGDRRAADAHVRAAAAQIEAADHPSVAWRVPVMEAMRGCWDGALEAALEACERASAMGIASGHPNARTTTIYQRQRILRMLGRRAEMAAGICELRTIFTEAPAMAGYLRCMVAAQLLHVGERAAALDTVDRACLLDTLQMGDRSVLEAIAEVTLALRDRELAEQIQERLCAHPDEFITGGVIGMTWEAPVHRVLALCAMVVDDHERAAEHLQRGIEAALRVGGEPIATWMQVELGELLMIMDRHERARDTLERAHKAARSLSMRSVCERAQAALDQPVATRAPVRVAPRAPAQDAPNPVFECEGDVWKVVYGGSSFRIKDSKGVRFIATLIERPGQATHALELASPGAQNTLDGTDAEVLDKAARAAYMERAQALREVLAEAEEWNDPARAEAARAELDALTTELTRGLGLGGRSRTFRSNAERARINVQRRIRDAIKRIKGEDAQLARHLERSIKTGMHCSYDPA